MSAILIRVFADGIVFGADRNVTEGDRCDGSERKAKICKSSDGQILIGSIGAAKLGSDWALDAIKEVVDSYRGSQLSRIAKEVQSAVFHQRQADDKDRPRAQIVNLAGFEKRNGLLLPEYWYISNCYTLTVDGNYADVRREFGCSDEIRIKMDEACVRVEDMRDRLKYMQERLTPFGFQHSINLAKFNILDQLARGAADALYRADQNLLPVTLDDWSKQVGLSVRLFGAYYETFEPEDKQYVGGGADVESILWPAS